MGGNALKNWGIERKEKSEFNSIVVNVCSRILKALPLVKITPVISYDDKSSFGDADILISAEHLPQNWIEQLKLIFAPQIWHSNGHIHSFDFQKLQIDLIVVPEKSFEFAQNYFNFNDLGNFMGRVARKMGFKYGHLGLYVPLYDGAHKYAELEISTNSQKVFEFMGYDFALHQKGFKSLEDVFTFAISSPYVHRDIFSLSARSRKAQKRYVKRPNYIAFIKWLETHPEADRYIWPDEPEEKCQPKDVWNNRAKIFFPHYESQIKEAKINFDERRAFNKKLSVGI